MQVSQSSQALQNHACNSLREERLSPKQTRAEAADVQCSMETVHAALIVLYFAATPGCEMASKR